MLCKLIQIPLVKTWERSIYEYKKSSGQLPAEQAEFEANQNAALAELSDYLTRGWVVVGAPVLIKATVADFLCVIVWGSSIPGIQDDQFEGSHHDQR